MRLDHGQIEVVDEDLAVVLRQKTGAERLRIASGMYSSVRRMILHRLRQSHPDRDERQIVAEAARRLSHGAIGSAPPDRHDD